MDAHLMPHFTPDYSEGRIFNLGPLDALGFGALPCLGALHAPDQVRACALEWCVLPPCCDTAPDAVVAFTSQIYDRAGIYLVAEPIWLSAGDVKTPI